MIAVIAIWLIGMDSWTINTGQNSLEGQNVRFCADARFDIQNSEKGCKDDRFCTAKKEIQNQDVTISLKVS